MDRTPTTEIETVLRKYGYANSGEVLDIVLDNWRLFREAELLEEAFLDAWTTQKWGSCNWTFPFCRRVFGNLDRKLLLNAGDPLPAGDSFIVYRGVAGIGAKRRVRGYSWSGNQGVAQFFAELRASVFRLHDPAVYSAVIQKEHVLTFIDDSGEKEFLVLPDALSQVRRIWRGEEAR